MALLQDKRKPVNIYDPESDTAKAQAATTDIVTAPMRFAGRQLDAATAPAQRVLNQTVVPAAVAVGNRLASDAAATTDVAQRVGLRQAIQQAPQGDVAGIRQAEAANPAPPPRLGGSAVAATTPATGGQTKLSLPAELMPSHTVAAPAPTGLAADRAADAMLYGNQAKIVGGNSPQAVAALPPPSPRLRPTVDMTPGGGMRNEQTGEVLTVGADRGAKIGAFDANGNPIDKVTPLRLGGRSAGGGSNYSFEGTADAAQRFSSAVSPGEYSPEAQAARDKQHEQFLGRNGYTKLTPVEQMVGRPLDSFKREQQPGVLQAGLNAMAAKDSNEVAKLNATGQAEERKVGLKVKQNELADQEEARALLAEMETANPARQQQIERKLVALGKKQPRAEKEPKVYFQKTYDDMGKVNGEEPFLYDDNTGEAKPLRLGGQKAMPTFKNRDEQKQYLINLAKTNPQEYARLKAAEAASVQ